MPAKKIQNAQSVDELEVLVGQGDTDAKRELARRLMEGNGVPQNHPKAVALLEDCVTLGDADAMLIFAKCFAFGRGMEHDAERAESLISEAANKGNEEALCLMELMNNWKGQKSVNLEGLSGSHRKKISGMFIFMFNTGQIKGELTIERVCLLMNIVPCKEFNLAGQPSQHIIGCTVFTNTVSWILRLLASTENDIGDTGATSLSDALKSNKTLAKLNLSGEHKRDNTQMAFINKQVFIVIISTENIIGDTGATSMSDVLKSNATLTKLHLWGDHKAITHMISTNNPLFFHSHQINREQHWRHRSNIIE